MAHKRNLCNKNNESKLNCDIDSDDYVKTQNQMRMKIIMMRKNNHHHQCNENIRKWGLQSQTDQIHVHQFTGGDRGKKQNKAPHINKEL
jgi:hypothetical protein